MLCACWNAIPISNDARQTERPPTYKVDSLLNEPNLIALCVSRADGIRAGNITG
jgi:hypothetical protein